MTKLFLLFLLLSLFSCYRNEQEKNEMSKIDTLKVIEQTGNKQPQIKILEFERYWKELGGAIQTNDTSKIKLLVNVPLNVYGHDDRDPRLKIDSNDIIKFVLLAINTGGYYDLEKNTSISYKSFLLSDLKSISEYKQGSDSQWIQEFVFEKNTNGWKLVTLYMDTREFKK